MIYSMGDVVICNFAFISYICFARTVDIDIHTHTGSNYFNLQFAMSISTVSLDTFGSARFGQHTSSFNTNIHSIIHGKVNSHCVKQVSKTQSVNTTKSKETGVNGTEFLFMNSFYVFYFVILMYAMHNILSEFNRNQTEKCI